jgi:hypothetical protein
MVLKNVGSAGSQVLFFFQKKKQKAFALRGFNSPDEAGQGLRQKTRMGW